MNATSQYSNIHFGHLTSHGYKFEENNTLRHAIRLIHKEKVVCVRNQCYYLLGILHCPVSGALLGRLSPETASITYGAEICPIVAMLLSWSRIGDTLQFKSHNGESRPNE